MELNQDFIEKKYLKIKSYGKDEDFLDEKAFGEIKIFINREPKNILFKLNFEKDVIYIGTN